VIGGEDVHEHASKAELIETKIWGVAELVEQGNIPIGLSKFAIAQIEPSKVLVFGGRDIPSKTPQATAYHLEMQEPLDSETGEPRKSGDGETRVPFHTRSRSKVVTKNTWLIEEGKLENVVEGSGGTATRFAVLSDLNSPASERPTSERMTVVGGWPMKQ
jgi:hypothetical protein